MKLSPTPLVGRTVRLEPLDAELKAPLALALAGHAQDWALMATSAGDDAFEGWWTQARLAQVEGGRIGYAVRRLSDGAIVGTTSFLDISPAHRRVEIGSTFLNAAARAGATNPDMKFTMLEHAFAAGAQRVELITDARNLRSQAAIAKLGAVREGVLRRHKVTWTGHVRDTVMFSITDADWPAVRSRLEERLEALALAASQGVRARTT